MKKNMVLAKRLGDILARLNQGERLEIHRLAEEFGVAVRTVQRDIKERLGFLEWEENGPRYYRINRQKFGLLTQADIERFALFASVSELFPKIDRTFYQEKLTESVQVKGFQYEDIKLLEKEFQLINQAIAEHCFIDFQYTKCGQKNGSFYKIAPYALINKNGIWYLIGTDDGKQKTFCFTQMKMLKKLAETFEPNPQFMEEIKQSDSISHGNQITEVVIQTNKFAAPYFLRRNLLPNQKLLHKLDDGGLLLASENVGELEIMALVQYWIPHLTIISPSELQERMIEKLQQYLSNEK